jgi:hypothetical protein
LGTIIIPLISHVVGSILFLSHFPTFLYSDLFKELLGLHMGNDDNNKLHHHLHIYDASFHFGFSVCQLCIAQIWPPCRAPTNQRFGGRAWDRISLFQQSQCASGGLCGVFILSKHLVFGHSSLSLPLFLGRQVLSKAKGLLQVCAAVVSFINIPLGNIAIERMEGSFFVLKKFI